MKKWMSPATHMNESCHTYSKKKCRGHTPFVDFTKVVRLRQIVLLIRVAWLVHMTDSFLNFFKKCHTYEWVMSHILTSHVTLMKGSRHTYEWVLSHIWRSHVTHTRVNESCHYFFIQKRFLKRSITMSSDDISGRLNPPSSGKKKGGNMKKDESVTPHIWMSHVTHVIWRHHGPLESSTTLKKTKKNEWAMPYRWMSHATHIIWQHLGPFEFSITF